MGPRNTPLLPAPLSPKKADYLFIESTYGNKIQEDVESRSRRLLSIIEHALQDSLSIILDSPLAKKVTNTYRQFKKLWGSEAKEQLDHHRHPLAFDQCITIESHADRLQLVNRLASTSEPLSWLRPPECVKVAVSSIIWNLYYLMKKMMFYLLAIKRKGL